MKVEIKKRTDEGEICLTAFEADNDLDILTELKDNIKALQDFNTPKEWDKSIAGAVIYVNDEPFEEVLPYLPDAEDMAAFHRYLDSCIQELEDYYGSEPFNEILESIKEEW